MYTKGRVDKVCVHRYQGIILKVGRIWFVYTDTRLCIQREGDRVCLLCYQGMYSKGRGTVFYTTIKVCILKVRGKRFFYTTTKVYILKVGGQFLHHYKGINTKGRGDWNFLQRYQRMNTKGWMDRVCLPCFQGINTKGWMDRVCLHCFQGV